MLRTLESCPTIINIFDCYTDEECYYIAMDYCTGGTMLDTLITAQTLSERVVADYLKILLKAIAYMHDKDIVHRDIKLNNLMLSEPPPFGKLRIIDFGDSDTIAINQSYNLWVGTMHYLPPETVRVRYGWEMKKGDMWAVGILTFVLVSGKIPFYGKTQKRILTKIQKGEYFWPMEPSKSCRDFVSKLLCLDTKRRLSAHEALEHEWIVSKASEVEFPPESLKRLKSLSYNNKLQRILVNAIFNEINEYEKDILMDGIKALDINNTGYVDANDIVTYLLTHSNQVQMTQSFATKQAEHIIQSVQPSLSRSSSRRSNGKISTAISIKDDLSIIDSLLVRTITSSASYSPTPIFVSVKNDVEDDDYFGDDDDGPVISVDSFCAIMKRSKKQYSIKSLVSELDPDGTGVIPITKIAMYGGAMRTISIGHEELREDLIVDSGQDVKLLSDFEYF